MNTTAIASSMDPVMFGITLAQFCISSAGLLINGFLVYAILRNKKLRSICCFQLILALAINDCAHELMMAIVPTMFAVTGKTVSLLPCFYLSSIALFTMMYTQLLMLLIGLDRFFSIFMPLCYKSLNMYHPRKYISILLGIPAVCIFYFTVCASYPFVVSQAEKQVFCQATDAMAPAMLSYALYLVMALNIGILVVYLVIWLLFKCKIVKLIQSNTERGLLRSLYVLMAITFICWLPVPIGGNFVLPYLQLSPTTLNLILRMLQQFQKIGQSANGLILYFSSSAYRKAMRKELDCIFRWMMMVKSNFCCTANNDTENTAVTSLRAQQQHGTQTQQQQNTNFSTNHHHPNSRICPVVKP